MKFILVPISEELNARIQLSHLCVYYKLPDRPVTEILLSSGESIHTTATPEQIDAAITKMKKDEEGKE